jgi:hypothetical protein
MGNFYVNYTLRNTTQQAVMLALHGRCAAVSPLNNGCLVVFDEASDEQDISVIESLASELSAGLRCAVLVVMNHDDGVLWYLLYEAGELVDEYESAPSYFDPDAEPTEPDGGDARLLCTAFGVDSVGTVEAILRKPALGDGGYNSESDRHRDLVNALNLPDVALGTGYSDVEQAALPDGWQSDSIA